MGWRKRKIVMLLLICFLFSGCAARSWTKKEKIYGAIYAGLAAIDAGQSNDIMYHSKDKCYQETPSYRRCEYSRYERNPIINGRSSDQVNFYFLTSVLMTLSAADYFEKYREEILAGGVIWELGFVQGNYQLGVGVRY